MLSQFVTWCWKCTVNSLRKNLCEELTGYPLPLSNHVNSQAVDQPILATTWSDGAQETTSFVLFLTVTTQPHLLISVWVSTTSAGTVGPDVNTGCGQLDIRPTRHMCQVDSITKSQLDTSQLDTGVNKTHGQLDNLTHQLKRTNSAISTTQHYARN